MTIFQTCVSVWISAWLLNSLDPLDPDAVVCDVQIIQDVSWVVLSEDFVDVQQAFEDAGFLWAQEHSRAGKWKNSVT